MFHTLYVQMGSFVPADSAVLGLVDKVFARVGSSDNVSKHMSTFHLEMSETAHILCNATRNSLVILDEIGLCVAHIQETLMQHASELMHADNAQRHAQSQCNKRMTL